jgi:TetR/AcrR family transcriptional regulator, cholesterol catabolism regulator
MPDPDDTASAVDDRPVIRPDILAAATRIISRRGFHGTSMQHIADELGIRKPSLYHHVRSKEDFLYAIHHQLLELMIDRTVEVLATSATPAQKLTEALRVNARLVAENMDGVNVLQKERDVVSGTRWLSIVSRRDFYEHMVRQILDEGQRVGTFVECDTSIAAKAILAMPSWMATWYVPGGPLSPEDCADTFARLVLRGLEQRD